MYTSVTSAESTKYQMEIYSNLYLVQNRHSVYFPMPTANHPMSLNFYIIEEKNNTKKII